jgi:hypothetical protein
VKLTNRRYIVALGFAMLVAASTAAIAAQAPQNPQTPATQPAPTTPPPATQAPPSAPATQPRTTVSAPPQTMTLVGCLNREEQVPGRTPNPVERAGITEDYILTSASVAPAGAAPAGATGSGTPSATGTSGNTPSTGSSYKLSGLDNDKLKTLAGKRVEVVGKVDSGDAKDVATGAARPASRPADIPEFEAVSIREVTGSCAPASAAPAR